MFSEEGVLLVIGGIVLALLVPTGLLVLASRTVWKESGGRVLQIFSIVVSSLGIVVTLLCLGFATIWKGPSGEWAVIALVPPFFIDLPAALIALVIALAVRRRVPPGIRKVSIPANQATARLP